MISSFSPTVQAAHSAVSLRNLKTVRVDGTVRILSQAEFLCEKGTDAKPSANELARFTEVRRRKTSLNAISQFRYGLNGLV